MLHNLALFLQDLVSYLPSSSLQTYVTFMISLTTVAMATILLHILSIIQQLHSHKADFLLANNSTLFFAFDLSYS